MSYHIIVTTVSGPDMEQQLKDVKAKIDAEKKPKIEVSPCLCCFVMFCVVVSFRLIEMPCDLMSCDVYARLLMKKMTLIRKKLMIPRQHHFNSY